MPGISVQVDPQSSLADCNRCRGALAGVDSQLVELSDPASIPSGERLDLSTGLAASITPPSKSRHLHGSAVRSPGMPLPFGHAHGNGPSASAGARAFPIFGVFRRCPDI